MTSNANTNSESHSMPWNNRWVQFAEIAIVFAPVLLVIVAFRMLGLNNPALMIAGTWIANVTMLGLIWLGIRMRRESWKSIGLSGGHLTANQFTAGKIGWLVLKSLAIFVFAVAGFVVGTIIMANIVEIPEGADMTKYNYLQGNLPMLLISLAGVYFVSSFGEEVVYRGFLITRLESIFGGKTRAALIAAVVLSSIVFGFAHFEWGATGIVQTACMGAALGVSFLLTGRRLWPLIMAHAYLDTLLLTQLYLAAPPVN